MGEGAAVPENEFTKLLGRELEKIKAFYGPREQEMLENLAKLQAAVEEEETFATTHPFDYDDVDELEDDEHSVGPRSSSQPRGSSRRRPRRPPSG